MRKQALIHCHALVDEIAQYCVEQGHDLDFETYRSIGTRPTSIHHAKGDHKEAVFALTESITAAVAEEEAATVEATAD